MHSTCSTSTLSVPFTLYRQSGICTLPARRHHPQCHSRCTDRVEYALYLLDVITLNAIHVVQIEWNMHSTCSTSTLSMPFTLYRQSGICTLPAQRQHSQCHSRCTGRVEYALYLLNVNTLNAIHAVQAEWNMHSTSSTSTLSMPFTLYRQSGICTLPAQRQHSQCHSRCTGRVEYAL